MSQALHLDAPCRIPEAEIGEAAHYHPVMLRAPFSPALRRSKADRAESGLADHWTRGECR
jgi:hypothetical protein